MESELEQEAFDKAMSVFRELRTLKRKNRDVGESFDDMTSAFRNFSEKIAGDAFSKIDFLVFDLVENLPEGNSVGIPGATLSNVRHRVGRNGYPTHEITVLDEKSTPLFRLKWVVRPSEGSQDFLITDISMLECPADNPEYPYAKRIASSSCIRKNDSAYDSVPFGSLGESEFLNFVEAVNVFRPLAAEKLHEYSYGEPYLGLEISRNELELMNYLPVINFDGGLPGDLCVKVFETMVMHRAKRAFLATSKKVNELAPALMKEGALYGNGVLVFNDADAYATVLKNTRKERAVLITKISLFVNHSTFLAITANDINGKPVKTRLVALETGPNVLRVADAYLRDETFIGIVGSYNHITDTAEFTREFIESECLSIAPFYTAYALEATELIQERAEIMPFDEMQRIHSDLDYENDDITLSTI